MSQEKIELTAEEKRLVEYDNNNKPIAPAPPPPLLISQSNNEAQADHKTKMNTYKLSLEAYNKALLIWGLDQESSVDDLSIMSSIDNNPNESIESIWRDVGGESDNDSDSVISHQDFDQNDVSISSFNDAQKSVNELQEASKEIGQTMFERWITQPLKVRREKQEAATVATANDNLKHGIEAMMYEQEGILIRINHGQYSYDVNIPGIGRETGALVQSVNIADQKAVRAAVIADLQARYATENDYAIPPIDLKDDKVFSYYLKKIRAINKAAYQINKPAILKNEGFFGRLGDLASRDRAEKSYKDQFKELVPDQMREAFLVRRITVGVVGIDQKTIEMKDLPDYYKAQIKSKKSQLIGINKAAGGTSAEDYEELVAQIEDCKVMERSLRIIVDAAHDPRINSAQFLDMQKACMEDISKRMEAAARRYQAFKEGITIKNTAIALGSTGALATAGYFMYGWINSGAATANAISDLAAMEAWFNGAGSAMGSWFTGTGSAMGSWFTGTGTAMGSGIVGTSGTIASWLVGTGLTIESGLISAGLLTAAGALTATGIGIIVAIGVGLLVAADHVFNQGRVRKASVKALGDAYNVSAKALGDMSKGIVGLVQRVNADLARKRMLSDILPYEPNERTDRKLTPAEALALADKLEKALILSEVYECTSPRPNEVDPDHLKTIIALKIQGLEGLPASQEYGQSILGKFKAYEGPKGYQLYEQNEIIPKVKARIKEMIGKEPRFGRSPAPDNKESISHLANEDKNALYNASEEALGALQADLKTAQADVVSAVREQFKKGKEHHMSRLTHEHAVGIVQQADIVIDNIQEQRQTRVKEERKKAKVLSEQSKVESEKPNASAEEQEGLIERGMRFLGWKTEFQAVQGQRQLSDEERKARVSTYQTAMENVAHFTKLVNNEPDKKQHKEALCLAQAHLDQAMRKLDPRDMPENDASSDMSAKF
ncbi:MAG: hypothetical protein GW760_05415 [Legionella sp.]|nr:hypothetical protein [Legionella sp.]